MKLLTYFKAFLEGTVNLNQTRLDLLDLRVSSIVGALENDKELGARVREHIPQGSWAHRTIIKPLNNHESKLALCNCPKQGLPGLRGCPP